MLEELARGLLLWAACGIFFAGLVFEGWRFFRLSRHLQRSPAPAAEGGAGRLQLMLRRWQRSWWREHPLMLTVTVVFHLLLFVVPIFLLAHNQLFEQAWGFGLPALDDRVADVLTGVVLVCGAVFLGRRLFLRRVRVLSTVGDYLALAVTLAPFVTGFMAYRHWPDYQPVLVAHMLSGELMLAALPFTKLGHMLFFFLYRFLLGGEYSFGRGRRAWKTE